MQGKPTMVRKILLAAMLLSLPAFAADFSGGYVGAFAGSASGDDVFHSDETNVMQTLEPSGSTYGFILGYNHQDGNFVVGTEFELGLGTADDFIDELDPANTFGYDMMSEVTVDYRWRARFGWAMGNFMPFIAGGVASASTTVTDDYTGSSGAVAIDVNRIGFGIGVGLDWQLNDQWSFRAEYITEDFGSAVFNDEFNVGDTWDMNLSLDTLRLAAAMHF